MFPCRDRIQQEAEKRACGLVAELPAPKRSAADLNRCDRSAVLGREGNFGINSEAGVRFVERILPLAGTTRRRGIDLLNGLTEAIQAERDGISPPVLA